MMFLLFIKIKNDLIINNKAIKNKRIALGSVFLVFMGTGQLHVQG